MESSHCTLGRAVAQPLCRNHKSKTLAGRRVSRHKVLHSSLSLRCTIPLQQPSSQPPALAVAIVRVSLPESPSGAFFLCALGRDRSRLRAKAAPAHTATAERLNRGRSGGRMPQPPSTKPILDRAAANRRKSHLYLKGVIPSESS